MRRAALRSVLLAGVLVAVAAPVRGEGSGDDRPVVDSEPGRRAYADVRRLYREHTNAAPAAVLQALASSDAAARREAAEYLLALFRQTAWDEEHGLTPERRGWKIGGGGPQDDGAEIRWIAADAF